MTADIIAETASLLTAVKAAKSVIEKRNSIPILNCCRIAATADGITVSGTDLDMEISAPAAGRGRGSLCVPVRPLLRVLREVDCAETVITMNGTRAHFTMGRVKLSLDGWPVEDFPAITMPDPMGAIAIGDLPWLLAPVVPCISFEEARYYLNGVFLRGDGRSLIAAATDGHRIAERRVDVGAEVPDIGHGGMIVPRKAVESLLSIADGEVRAEFTWPTPTGEVEHVPATRTRPAHDRPVMTKVHERARFITPRGTLTTKLIDGKFPDYGKIFSKAEEAAATAVPIRIRTADLAGFLRCEIAKGEPIKIAQAGGKPTLSMTDMDTGTVEMKADGEYPTELGPVGFNPKFVADFLPFMGDVATIVGPSAFDPFVFVAEDQSTRLVAMAMRP